MSKPQPLPTGGPSREETARRELGHTTVTPTTVGVLLLLFLPAIAGVMIAELAGARTRASNGGDTAWSQLFGLRAGIDAHLTQESAPEESGLWERLLSTNRIVLAGLSAFERTLEDESLIGRSLRPPTQIALTRWLGAGNERVYPGRDNWVFYRQDVEYVTGSGFLDPARMRRRIRSAPEWTAPPQPDPRLAIVQFRNDLAARGVTLVVMPTPLKPSVHPEMLARRYEDAAGVLQNPSYERFVADIRGGGVLVFDPAEALTDARGNGPLFLATDTHWRPEAMEVAAERLAAFITANADLPAIVDPGYRVQRPEARNRGDAARMLDLPDDDQLFPPEPVYLRRILQQDGSPWRSSREADVLVLGDSFTNIYALESMGWGTSAGFVEQLSYTLRRPVDRLAQNDEGAFATRAMLGRDPARLDGKRVVVYQFAARELAFGDWKMIPLP